MPGKNSTQLANLKCQVTNENCSLRL